MSAPLFCVFSKEDDVLGQQWTVQAVNLEGEPERDLGIHSEHATLDDALYEATWANRRFSRQLVVAAEEE